MKNKTLLKIHFCFLALSLLHAALVYFTSYSLVHAIIIPIHGIVGITGLLLFVTYFKQKKWITAYFWLYGISAIFAVLAFIFRGIVAALFLSILASPFWPDTVKYTKDDIVFVDQFNGFMSSCCSLTVKQQSAGIFNKELGKVFFEVNYSIKNIAHDPSQKTIQITYSQPIYNDSLKVYQETILIKDFNY